MTDLYAKNSCVKSGDDLCNFIRSHMAYGAGHCPDVFEFVEKEEKQLRLRESDSPVVKPATGKKTC